MPQQVGAGKVSKPRVLLPAGCRPLVTDLCEASICWQAWADPMYLAAETAAASATLLLPIRALVKCVVMRLYQTLLIFERTCVSQKSACRVHCITCRKPYCKSALSWSMYCAHSGNVNNSSRSIQGCEKQPSAGFISCLTRPSSSNTAQEL